MSDRPSRITIHIGHHGSGHEPVGRLKSAVLGIMIAVLVMAVLAAALILGTLTAVIVGAISILCIGVAIVLSAIRRTVR